MGHLCGGATVFVQPQQPIDEARLPYDGWRHAFVLCGLHLAGGEGESCIAGNASRNPPDVRGPDGLVDRRGKLGLLQFFPNLFRSSTDAAYSSSTIHELWFVEKLTPAEITEALSFLA